MGGGEEVCGRDGQEVPQPVPCILDSKKLARCFPAARDPFESVLSFIETSLNCPCAVLTPWENRTPGLLRQWLQIHDEVWWQQSGWTCFCFTIALICAPIDMGFCLLRIVG